MFNVLFEHNFQGKASPVCEQKLCSHEFVERKAHWGGNIAQLVEHRASTLLRQFNSLVWQGIFLPESTFSADSLTVSVHQYVQSHKLISVRTLDIV